MPARTSPGRIDGVATETLLRHFQTKVVGPWELARSVAPHMRRQGGGRFIVIIGQTGKVPQANAIASTVINAAQHAFVKSLSDELAQDKILVNAVCPSRIKSPLTDGLKLYNEVYLGRSLEQQESRLGRRSAARPLGHARRHRQCGRVPRLGARRIHLRHQHRRRRRTPAVDLLKARMIRIENISKSFYKGDTAVDAVRDMNLTIERHEIVAVIGPSGCGKSTLLNMIAGLYAPTRGQIVYKGATVSDVNTDVGYMTQKDNLLPWRSVRDNVAFPLELAGVPRPSARARADEVIQHVGLQGFEDRYPNELSGGMRKRACLGRMLLYGAETALLDEPFAALDAQLKLAMHDLMLRLVAENKQTVILVTHDLMEAVTLADRVLVCTRRPATIAMEQRIDLARPRDVLNVRFSNAFKEHYDALWERLRVEYQEERV